MQVSSTGVQNKKNKDLKMGLCDHMGWSYVVQQTISWTDKDKGGCAEESLERHLSQNCWKPVFHLYLSLIWLWSLAACWIRLQTWSPAGAATSWRPPRGAASLWGTNWSVCRGCQRGGGWGNTSVSWTTPLTPTQELFFTCGTSAVQLLPLF